MEKKCRIAVLVSGGGTNLQALIDAEKSGIIASGQIVLVASNNPEAYALTRAREAGISAFVFTDEADLVRILEGAETDLIILAGFLKILSAEFTAHFAGRIINIHPALLPSFGGKGCYGIHVHEKALEYGVKVTGATVHFVNEVPDGGRIICQKAVEVKDGDTPALLQRRVMEEAEWVILPQAAEKICRQLLKEKVQEKENVMKPYETKSFRETVSGNPYVGRGIVLGCSADGRNAVTAYFIMGRSENSRNRVFCWTEDGIMIKPYDESKVKDPSLIIYYPLREIYGDIIITNGDQTDTIYDCMSEGGSFAEALRTRTFEPDGPNWTPRISGFIDFDDSDTGFRYALSILKSADPEGTACNRYFYEYEPVAGLGHFIHTYITDGNPLPTFTGEPERITIPNDITEFSKEIWDSLDADNRISLYVRYTDLESGECEEYMINKHEEEEEVEA